MTVLAPLLVVGDGVVRHGRSRILTPQDFSSDQ
jgi:hypothetical protein